MRFCSLLVVCVMALPLLGGEPGTKTKRDECWGTVFKMTAKEVVSLEAFYADWDKDVVSRARSWANIANPYLMIVLEKKDDKTVMKRIYAASDAWGRGKTPMEAVAKEYEGKVLTRRELNRLAADMRTAYHEYFAEEKK